MLNGAAAADAMKAFGRNEFAACLFTVWKAYGYPHTLGPQPGRSFATAMDSYNYTTRRHPGDWHPPAGVPVWFGVSPTRTDVNRGAGDVGISVGGGKAVFTDSSRGNTYIGVMTLAARAREIERPYLGWTEDFGGNLISFAAIGTPVIHITPNTPAGEEEDDDMKNSGFYYARESDKAIVYLIANTGSGFWSEYTDGSPNRSIPGSYNNEVAATFGTGSFAHITEGHATAIKRDCDKVRTAK